MKSILRFEKLKSFSQIKEHENHNYRKVIVNNANRNIKNVKVIHNPNLLNNIKNILKEKNIFVRKNAVIAIDCCLSLSPAFFRENKEEYGVYDIEKVKVFRNRAKEFLTEQFGENVISAVLHLDEATPHIHATILPIEFDSKKNKYKLNARKVLSISNLYNYQKLYNDKFKIFGVTYEHKSKAEHKDIKVYYEEVNKELEKKKLEEKKRIEENMKLVKRIEELEKEIEVKDYKYNKLLKSFKNLLKGYNRLKTKMEIIMKKFRDIIQKKEYEELSDTVDFDRSLEEMNFQKENEFNSNIEIEKDIKNKNRKRLKL